MDILLELSRRILVGLEELRIPDNVNLHIGDEVRVRLLSGHGYPFGYSILNLTQNQIRYVKC